MNVGVFVNLALTMTQNDGPFIFLKCLIRVVWVLFIYLFFSGMKKKSPLDFRIWPQWI